MDILNGQISKAIENVLREKHKRRTNKKYAHKTEQQQKKYLFQTS